MIKLEHVVLASPEQIGFIIQGLRNPMNSWDKSDSDICRRGTIDCSYNCAYRNTPSKCPADIDDSDQFIIGPNDHILMQRLANAGTDHRKFMRMMPVYVRITAPLYLSGQYKPLSLLSHEFIGFLKPCMMKLICSGEANTKFSNFII